MKIMKNNIKNVENKTTTKNYTCIIHYKRIRKKTLPIETMDETTDANEEGCTDENGARKKKNGKF